jgi:tetratricopeptide (TPR) repeat protein
MAQKQEKKDIEAEIWNAISAFEQILEAMPNDKASLEALSHAYEQIGDHTKAKEYFIRLGNVLVDEGEVFAAGEIEAKIKEYAGDDSDAAALIKRISAMVADKNLDQGAASSAARPAEKGGGKKTVEKVRTTFNIAEELAFAWNLMEAKELTQEEYSNVVQDLTEMSAGDSVATISVLHVLEARTFKNLDRIIGFLTRECGTPFVSVACFDIMPAVIAILPREFMVRRGAMIFELIGKNALAVVMNPYDKQLRKDVESVSGQPCHFYMTLPSEFDQAVQKINDMVTEKEAREKGEPARK